MAKQKLQMQDISDVLAAAIEPFQAPPLVAAPYTTITDLSGNPRKLADPSKTIRPILGNERIHTRSIKLINNEKGPNGEPVYGIEGDDRIRFVGSGWRLNADAAGTRIWSQTNNDFVEVTFYGTQLNLVGLLWNSTQDFRVSVDGGGEGANIFPASLSAVLNGRNYVANQPLSITSSLSLGLHTVKLRNNSPAVGNEVCGFEIINQASSIKVPQGKLFNNGKGLTLNSLQSLAYDSDFAIGTPNGRGGRVVVYSEGNQLKKAIQPVDASAAYLASANHANEEIIRKINWREFGANRSDDFSTLAGVSSDRAFTLDDGTTTLVANDVIAGTYGSVSVLTQSFGSGPFVTLTFVGTGLDLVLTGITTPVSLAISIDGGVSVGNVSVNSTTGAQYVEKIVSGLPYGTHTVRIAKTVAGNDVGISDFIIYGPKKPTLPEGTIEVGEYYLMSNYSSNLTQGINNISQSVIRKFGIRELVYTGANWTIAGANPGAYTGGFILYTNGGTGQTMSYTFWGTGIELRSQSFATNSSNVGVLIDGLVPSGTAYGNWTYSAGTLNQAATANSQPGSGVIFSGLSLGKHTITFTNNNAGQFVVDALDIITPVHFPNTKAGSLSMGPGVEVKRTQEENNVDLSKAKAWALYRPSAGKLITSYNISAVLTVAAGRYIFYFEKPFKTDSYVALATTSSIYQIGFYGGYVDYQTPNAFGISIVLANAGGDVDSDVYVVFFGELEEEGD